MSGIAGLTCLMFAFIFLDGVRTSFGQEEPTPECYRQHLAHAIALNQARLPIYSLLTQGKSEAISNRLIFWERTAIPVAWTFQWRASRFWDLGIPIGCLDFVPIELDLEKVLQVGPDLNPEQNLIPINHREVQSEIRKKLANRRWKEVSELAHLEIKNLAPSPNLHCLYRHVMESIARVAHLAPQYAQTARKKNLTSRQIRRLDNLSAELVQQHLFTLSTSIEIDRLAAPLQNKGVAIICQDVPTVPTRPIFRP